LPSLSREAKQQAIYGIAYLMESFLTAALGGSKMMVYAKLLQMVERACAASGCIAAVVEVRIAFW
jgi:hypothetical protein